MERVALDGTPLATDGRWVVGVRYEAAASTLQVVEVGAAELHAEYTTARYPRRAVPVDGELRLGVTWSEAQRQPWIDILADVRYLFDEAPDLSPEEKTIMTELRQRWEREKAELRAESKAEAILTVLATRGFKVSDGVRQHVLGCKDPSILERWLARAVTATSDTEVIAA